MRRLAPDLDRERLLDDAIDASGLVPVEVEGWTEPAFADPALISAPAPQEHRATLLSPFDSLIWAGPPPAGSPPREHTQRLFGYQYELELYKPKAARIHGYFTMPLLARGGIAGHVDPAREGRTFVAHNVVLHDRRSARRYGRRAPRSRRLGRVRRGAPRTRRPAAPSPPPPGAALTAQ